MFRILLSFLGNWGSLQAPMNFRLNRILTIIIIIMITPLGPRAVRSIYLHIFLHGVWLRVCSWSSRYQPLGCFALVGQLYTEPRSAVRLWGRPRAGIARGSSLVATTWWPSWRPLLLLSRAPKSKRPPFMSIESIVGVSDDDWSDCAFFVDMSFVYMY